MLGAVEHKTVHVDLRSIGGSALTADIDVPDRRRRRHSGHVRAGAQHDHARRSRSAGPKCSARATSSAASTRSTIRAIPIAGPEFIEAFETLANLATKAGVEGHAPAVHAPLIRLSKADIVREGVRLGVDFAATVSCYQADAEAARAAHCDACRLRARGICRGRRRRPDALSAPAR